VLALAGCSGLPSSRGFPPDVPDPSNVRVTTAHGFRLFVDGGCLDTHETERLVNELTGSRTRVVAYLADALAPASFRPYGVPRAECPSTGPPPIPEPIDVVIVRSGKRCHADRHGITVTQAHLPRFDATHELVHYLAGSSWRPIDEGLAVYLTEKICGPDQRVPVKVRARVFLDLNLDVDLHPATVRKTMSRRDYDTAGAFVGWLIEAYGKDRFLRLYGGPVRDFHTVYDKSEPELWQRFWLYIRNLDVRKESAYYAFKARLTQPK
jgi:hypothetical protein